jgi:probable phosphoglycerate mutase
MTTLTLIRHAQARAGVDGIIGGPTGDTGLTELGRRQAEALRDRLHETGFTVDVVLTSVLPRAIETAEILAPSSSGIGAIEDCDFCELHPGEADGLTWAEYQQRYPAERPRDPDARFAPGGESVRELADRAARAVDDLVTRFPHEKIAMVTHGGFITAACLHLLGYQMGALRSFVLDPENTSLTTWTQFDGDPRRWRFDRYNDAAHLDSVS